MKTFITIFALFLLVACQSPLIQTDGSYLKPDSTSTIEITQSLDVSPNFSRAFLQAGKNILPESLNLYLVNCEVEINTVSENEQIIKPDKFNIIAISQEDSPIVMIKPVMVASLNYASSPSDIKRFFRFHLSTQNSSSKSDVRALICRGIQARHGEAQLPTLEQMQTAAGSYIKFNL